MYIWISNVCAQREITRKLTFPKQPTNPFLEMVKFLLERIAPVHIDSEAIRSASYDRNIKHTLWEYQTHPS